MFINSKNFKNSNNRKILKILKKLRIKKLSQHFTKNLQIFRKLKCLKKFTKFQISKYKKPLLYKIFNEFKLKIKKNNWFKKYIKYFKKLYLNKKNQCTFTKIVLFTTRVGSLVMLSEVRIWKENRIYNDYYFAVLIIKVVK